MRKETAQEINRLSNKVQELEAKLKTATENLNFYKNQDAEKQRIIARLEAREERWKNFIPNLEAPAVEMPEPTKEDC